MAILGSTSSRDLDQAKDRSRLFDGANKSSRVSVTETTFNHHSQNERITMCVLLSQYRWRTRLLSRNGEASAVHKRIERIHRVEEMHNAVQFVALAIALLEVALVPLNISWANLPERAPVVQAQADLLKWSSIVGIAFFLIHRCYIFFHPKRFRRTVLFATVDLLLWLLHAVTLFLFLRGNAWHLDREKTTAVALTAGQQAVLIVLGTWRIARTLQSTSNVTISDEESEPTEGSQVLGVESFTLVWVTRSADLLIGYLPELHNMLVALRNSLEMTEADSGVGDLLRVKIFCTDPDRERLHQLKEQVNFYHLEGDVHFERPDLPKVILEHTTNIIRSGTSLRTKHRSLLTFCGAPSVARICLDSCATANELAARIGSTMRIDFRDEYYGHTGGAGKHRGRPTFPWLQKSFNEASKMRSVTI